MSEPLLTASEVCKLLRVSRSALQRLIARESLPLPHVPLGAHTLRFRASDVQRWVDQVTEEATRA